MSEEKNVEYRGLVKRLDLPPGYVAPTRLSYADLRARALTRADLHDDIQAINSSLETIRRTRGGNWPTEAVSEDFDYVDLVWHECEFREGSSFTYAVYDAGDRYLGCCYLYPMGSRVELTEDRMKYDVDVSWWVTEDAYARGYYGKVYAALQHWISNEFPFQMAYFSNAEIPGVGGSPERPAGLLF